MASEIIGYFNIPELKESLPALYEDAPGKDEQWPGWQLNCLWAHSRFEEYREVHDLLLSTTSSENQQWLLYIYEQMTESMHAKPEDFIPTLNQFLKRNDIGDSERKETRRVLTLLTKGSNETLEERWFRACKE